jgi:hypothetical protein
MRFALSSLILAAGLAGVAQAQTPPAPPPAPPAPATAPAAPGPGTAAPGAMAAPPAAAPAAPPAGGGSIPTLPGADQAPPPAPTLPTTGDGATAISILEKVCVPSVKGGKFEDIAKAAGAKLNRRDQTWVMPFGTDRNYSATLFPPGSNRGVCTVELHYAAGGDAEILKALNVWAFVHQPPLDPTANYTQPQDPDGLKRVRRSWEYLTANSSVGLNFSTVRKPDDSPLNPKFDTATMQYQERTF